MAYVTVVHVDSIGEQHSDTVEGADSWRIADGILTVINVEGDPLASFSDGRWSSILKQ